MPQNTQNRQPIEDRQVTIARAAGSLTFPANFMLIAAMNPCPCGYYSDPKRQCRCSVRQIENYRQRISGPLLDRIDIHCEVPLVDFRKLSFDGVAEKPVASREDEINQCAWVKLMRLAVTDWRQQAA